MIKVGLTGGIGSGKTTIAHFFEILGIPIYYSDSKAKALMMRNLSLKKQLIDVLGRTAYLETGELNRKYISDLIFNNQLLLEQINAIIHPFVEEDFEDFCSLHKDKSYVIKESAILIETELYKQLDKIILVISESTQRVQRVMDRDALSQESVLQKISKQFTDQEKRKFSDYIIENNNNKLLIPQLLSIHNQLLK